MKRKILGKTLISIGIIIIVYPFILRLFWNNKVDKKVSELKEHPVIDNIKNVDALLEAMKIYNEDLLKNGQTIVDPFSFQELDFNLQEYGVEENIVGTLYIEKLDVELPIYLGATIENMKYGAVHLSHTSLPIGTTNSNVVLAAHRGAVRHKMFRDIEKMEIGDEVKITNFWEELTYKVTSTKIIEPNEVSKVLIQQGKDMITLITCHPYTKNTHRYVVYCERN